MIRSAAFDDRQGPLSVEGGSWNSPDIEWNNNHQFRSAMNCPASTMTVCQELRRMGFHGRAATHKPNILPLNAKCCLKCCKERRHWTVDNLTCVIWGDELRYIMWRSNGRVWMWWIPGERYLPACVVPTVKSVGDDNRVWGCFSWNGLGPLVILHGNIRAVGYKDIFTHCVLSNAENQFSDDDCLYQHDNAPCQKTVYEGTVYGQ
jgi:hypothetical protein